jgi:hypothetical protein
MAGPALAAIIAAVAAAGSMYANNKANSTIARKQGDAMNAFYKNMDQLRAQARAASTATAEGYTNVPGQSQQAANDISQRMHAATRMPIQTAQSVNPIADSTSGRVANESQRRSTQEMNYTDRLGDALSKTLGYDRMMGEADLLARQNAMTLRNVGTSARFDQGVLDSRLAAAPAYGVKYQQWGDLLSMVSQAAMASALKGPKLNTPAEAAKIPVIESKPMPRP